MSRSCGSVTAIKHNDMEDFPLWVGGIAAHSELSAKGGLSEADRHLDKPEKQAEVAGFTAEWSATTPQGTKRCRGGKRNVAVKTV